MSNPTIQPLTQELFLDFLSRHYFSAKMDDPEFYQGYLHDKTFGYIVLGDHGRAIGAFGLNIAWRGVGEVWLFSTDQLNRYPIWMVKNMRGLIQSCFDRGGLHRIQMFVDNEQENLHKWALTLGFELEGVMRKHSANGQDHAVYAKIA